MECVCQTKALYLFAVFKISSKGTQDFQNLLVKWIQKPCVPFGNVRCVRVVHTLSGSGNPQPPFTQVQEPSPPPPVSHTCSQASHRARLNPPGWMLLWTSPVLCRACCVALCGLLELVRVLPQVILGHVIYWITLRSLFCKQKVDLLSAADCHMSATQI